MFTFCVMYQKHLGTDALYNSYTLIYSFSRTLLALDYDTQAKITHK